MPNSDKESPPKEGPPAPSDPDSAGYQLSKRDQKTQRRKSKKEQQRQAKEKLDTTSKVAIVVAPAEQAAAEDAASTVRCPHCCPPAFPSLITSLFSVRRQTAAVWPR